ncbi:phage tail protein [Bacillus pseudomycoides]|nr:phage tail protein [Bacillus pseudomycoides]
MSGITVGLRDLHWAPLIKDDETGCEYDEPIKIAGLIEAKTSTKSDSAKLEADDGIYATASSFGGAEIEINVADIPLSIYAKWLGKKMIKGQVVDRADDVPPYGALMYRLSKDNGKFRYSCLYKMKFELPDEEGKTSGEKVDFQTAKIKGTAITRKSDKAWRNRLDEDEEGFDEQAAANWFKKVPPLPTESQTASITKN